MNSKVKQNTFYTLVILAAIVVNGCGVKSSDNENIMLMKEAQISLSQKNHALDNNDNFSPDDRFICYDTRGTVFNDNIGNSKTIEKIEVSTGKETILYQPESITGENAAPGVGAVSWHPAENKVIFIHGPNVNEVEERGYYGIPNRTAVEVAANGSQKITLVDMRDVSPDRPTTPGAQRGGTHRHEYSRNGQRIGFTYNDFLVQNIDRTIGYMEPNANAPEGYTHYFAVILKPAEKGKSKPGEIEKAYGDSWVNSEGTMRAFIGVVRDENGVDYNTSLFVADIPKDVDITTAKSGDSENFPEPPEGIKIRRLTYNQKTSGICRGSEDGKRIVYLAKDENDIDQVFVIDADGSELSESNQKRPQQVSHFSSDASSARWSPRGKWIFATTNGNIAALYVGNDDNFGKLVMLTNDAQDRNALVVSHDGNTLAYDIDVKAAEGEKVFKQIFTLNLDWEKLNSLVK